MKTVLFSGKTRPDPELLTLKEELLAAQADLANAYRQFDQALDRSWWNPAFIRSAP